MTSTLEPEPPYAADLLGDRADVVRAFAADLAEHGEPLGLIGPAEPARLWTRHILNSALLAPLLPAGGVVGDVGTGGGLPGLVIAGLRPDVRFVLIEPMERRTDWLRAESDRLGLGNVEVERGRAEESAWIGRLDAVTARAVANLAKLLPWVAPLAAPGGELVLLKGAAAQEELDAAAKTVRRLRLEDARVELLEGPGDLEPTRVVRARVAR